MAAVYDSIAQQYKNTNELPFCQYIEEYTYLPLLGDLSGKSILDLGCGEGRYTRKIKKKGAAQVVGVDISGKMIELARQEEKKKPLGIDYIVRDICELGEIDRFDMVVGSYFLNHAKTREELLKMCQSIYINLKPGGRFVTINNNSEQSPDSYSKTKKYGYTKSISGSLYEGAPITVTLTAAEGQEVSVVDYYLSNATHDSVFRSVGFKEIHWHPLSVSPEGIQELGQEYWQDFLDCETDVCIECMK
uniref:Ubiquinone/menaquinone biosynthesis C-methylase UbiE n=1 Tax=Candidatus Kentrum sp. LPFa TaxID=2126335 RepID=A0A450XT43_9GAMM|nr:MAG: Ubiquinone/menaquinone biosynthesis C-methylase UbiE [Candidatus Kentron sp. LPFa]VFK32418.1 MAG: Ubiquinone/menaquinone biosynthesis C-methylase UbiE [Candidatus Kentron sp. LPFa]